MENNLLESLTPEQKQQFDAEVTKLSEEKIRPVVEELKQIRIKNQELEKNQKPATEPDEVEKKVSAVLALEREKEAEKNRERAQEIFFDENKEFHPDNDPGGIKRAALERELQTFTLNGLSTIDEFKAVLLKAKRLVIAPSHNDDAVRLDASVPGGGGSPQGTSSTKLTPQEQKIIKDLGWTEDRFLALKTKQPDYVASLMRQSA